MALLIGAVTGSSDPEPDDTGSADAQGALNFSAPPRATADEAACTKVLAQLPVALGRLTQRVVHTKPDTTFVVAWGSPPVVLRCGENRPASLKAGSDATFQNAGSLRGPWFDITRDGDANVWTSVDRAAYVSVTIPRNYVAGDVVPPLAAAIGTALPAVCTTDSATPDIAKLCTRRK